MVVSEEQIMTLLETSDGRIRVHKFLMKIDGRYLYHGRQILNESPVVGRFLKVYCKGKYQISQCLGR